VVLRRTNLAFVGGVTIDLLDELADVMAESLEWTTEERADEVQRTLDVLRESHGVIVPLTSATQPA
jgi:glycerol-3-phosphate dehydrogenase